jgi:hypothetical protein
LVAVRAAITTAAVDQPLDLAFGQVLAGADVGVFGPARRDFPYFWWLVIRFSGLVLACESALSLQ